MSSVSRSNVTRRGMPMRTSSGATPTTFATSTSRSCSASSMMPITYGSSAAKPCVTLSRTTVCV